MTKKAISEMIEALVATVAGEIGDDTDKRDTARASVGTALRQKKDELLALALPNRVATPAS